MPRLSEEPWNRQEHAGAQEDAFHCKVPRRLEKAFFGRREIVKWCVRLDLMKMYLQWFSEQPWGRHLDRPALMRRMQGLRATVLRAAPFCACDCLADEADCPKCRGDRWVTVDQCPEEFKGKSEPP